MICKPATSELWGDMEQLLGERGACDGCMIKRGGRGDTYVRKADSS